jgi:hypothetical protein
MLGVRGGSRETATVWRSSGSMEAEYVFSGNEAAVVGIGCREDNKIEDNIPLHSMTGLYEIPS